MSTTLGISDPVKHAGHCLWAEIMPTVAIFWGLSQASQLRNSSNMAMWRSICLLVMALIILSHLIGKEDFHQHPKTLMAKQFMFDVIGGAGMVWGTCNFFGIESTYINQQWRRIDQQWFYIFLILFFYQQIIGEALINEQALQKSARAEDKATFVLLVLCSHFFGTIGLLWTIVDFIGLSETLVAGRLKVTVLVLTSLIFLYHASVGLLADTEDVHAKQLNTQTGASLPGPATASSSV